MTTLPAPPERRSPNSLRRLLQFRHLSPFLLGYRAGVSASFAIEARADMRRHILAGNAELARNEARFATRHALVEHAARRIARRLEDRRIAATFNAASTIRGLEVRLELESADLARTRHELARISEEIARARS